MKPLNTGANGIKTFDWKNKENQEESPSSRLLAEER
jgi:hypothetical protein